MQNLVHWVKNTSNCAWFVQLFDLLEFYTDWYPYHSGISSHRTNLFWYLFSIFECILSRKSKTKMFSSEVISSCERSIWAEWGQFEVISDILRYPCVLMGGIFKALYVRLSDFFLISSGSPLYDSLSLISQNIMGLWIFFILRQP